MNHSMQKPLQARISARSAALLASALLGAATTAYGQNECAVVSTFAGRWYRVELACGSDPEEKPRAAVVSEELRACPLWPGIVWP